MNDYKEVSFSPEIYIFSAPYDRKPLWAIEKEDKLISDFQKTEEKILVTYIDVSTDQSFGFANYLFHDFSAHSLYTIITHLMNMVHMCIIWTCV